MIRYQNSYFKVSSGLVIITIINPHTAKVHSKAAKNNFFRMFAGRFLSKAKTMQNEPMIIKTGASISNANPMIIVPFLK